MTLTASLLFKSSQTVFQTIRRIILSSVLVIYLSKVPTQTSSPAAASLATGVTCARHHGTGRCSCGTCRRGRFAPKEESSSERVTMGASAPAPSPVMVLLGFA